MGRRAFLAWKTRRLDPPQGPLPGLRIDSIASGGMPLPRVDQRGQEFVLAFYDGPPGPAQPSSWSWATMLWTPGGGQPTPVGGPPAVAHAAASLVEDAGFEEGLATLPVSLDSGQVLPGATLGRAWVVPAGGRWVLGPAHSGQAAAEVQGAADQYRLWRQHLQAARFTPGSRWRLSAWVKGEGIAPGNAAWKRGILCLGLTADKWAGWSTKLAGTFDWQRVSVDVRIPPNLRDAWIETGLNGATGKMWIDDVELQPLPD